MVFVDSCVIVDLTSGAAGEWRQWSFEAYRRLASADSFAANAIVFAEVAVVYRTPEEVLGTFASLHIELEPLTPEVAFEASRAFREYRRRGGPRSWPLPDFFIGAHATVLGVPLLTRDAKRFRTSFPSLDLLCPPGT